tara:strand:+ start:45 stop:221 length:177 start_codon:yes stop_codon:yes gene_type:complete
MRKDFLGKIKFYIKTEKKNIAGLIKRKRLSSRFQIKKKLLSLQKKLGLKKISGSRAFQ